MQLRIQGLDLLASVVCRAEGRRKAEVRAGARHRKRRKVPSPMTKNDLQRTQGPLFSNGALVYGTDPHILRATSRQQHWRTRASGANRPEADSSGRSSPAVGCTDRDMVYCDADITNEDCFTSTLID